MYHLYRIFWIEDDPNFVNATSELDDYLLAETP